MLLGRMKSDTSFVIKYFKPCLKVCFSLTCFLLAGYMAFLQFQAYFANEDSSVITYEEFNQDNTNMYPTFTICLVGKNGAIYGNALNRSFASKYYKTMIGELEDRENLTLIEFEDMVSQLFPMIESFRTKTTEDKGILYTRPLNKSPLHSGFDKLTFSTTYHDTDQVCYTKDKNLREVWILLRDNMIINVEEMMRNKYSLKFYVHQRGQLLKKLGSPDYRVRPDSIVRDAGKDNGFLYGVILRITSLDVVAKRPDAVPSCNPELLDEDMAWINNTTKVLGCVPPFLKGLVRDSLWSEGNKTGLTCTQKQYRSIKKNFNPRYVFHRWTKLYSQPCTQMTSTTVAKPSVKVCKESKKCTKEGGAKRRIVELNVKYEAVGFREIRNYRAFGLLSLWSQIGGFIGMFLGYSLLQVPELIAYGIGWVKLVMNQN